MPAEIAALPALCCPMCDAWIDLVGAQTQGQLTPALARAAGIAPALLHRAVGADQLVRLRRRVYAREPLAPLPRFVVVDGAVSAAYVAQVRAALLSLGPNTAARLRTAAALRGWALLVEPSRTIELAVPHGRGTVTASGVRATQCRRFAPELVQVLPNTAAMRVMPALETVVEAALELPVIEAVVLCDSALRAGDVTVPQLVRAARLRRGTRNARRLRRIIRLCDARAGSVLESVQRVRMLQAGLTGFDTQVVLRDRPQLRVDFCFRSARLVVEVDGQKWHQDPAVDRARDNALASLGWRVLRFTWAEVVHDSAAVLAQIIHALQSQTLQPVAGEHRAAA